MKILLIALTLSLMFGCKSSSNLPPETVSKLRNGLEVAIAREILTEVKQELPKLKGSVRYDYLAYKANQFRRSVDLNALNSWARHEFELLTYMTELEKIYWHQTDYETRVGVMSSLEIDLPHLELLLISSLKKIDQKLAMLIKGANQNVSSHMTQVREDAIYPEDSFIGKQDYLAALELEMISSFQSWKHLSEGASPNIELLGEYSDKPTFFYKKNKLTINLSKVNALPNFELASIATFYGYPGQAALATDETPPSLNNLLQLPGVDIGWAWYKLERIAKQDIKHIKQHLYFSKLITSAALADLRLHTRKWSKDEAAENIYRETPYTMNRINGILEAMYNKPGYYLAAFAGKTRLIEIESRCITDCEADLPKRLISLGPLPFDLLEERLITEKIIQ